MRARVVVRTALLTVVACLAAAVGALPRPAAATEIGARLSRSRISVGEVTTLVVTVRGASGGVSDPEFTVPDGLGLLSSGRAQNFTWVNGRSSVEIIYRFEIEAEAAGSFALGPITVRVGKEAFRSGVLSLDASAAPTRLRGSGPGTGAASLQIDVLPASPWQGQPCVLRVRLIQRAALAEDPRYTPPTTPGFWTDKSSQPESYYADERGHRVLVTETRTRLFPLAAGIATIGEAEVSLALATGSDDPMAWLGGRVPRREEVVRSRPIQVRVRALPASAPAGFTGAVGELSARWTADRARTTVDVPITVRLDVRGAGNLPLVRPPELTGDDIDVFASTVDDSLPSGGPERIGRRRFQWTVLARRPGMLTLSPPPFAWFDPASASYRRSDGAPIRIDVGPALFAAAGEGSGLPPALGRHPVDPGARSAQPWGWSLAALFLAGSVALWRVAAAPPASSAARGQALEWLRAVGRARGPDFWRAADEAATWLERQGRPMAEVRRAIAAARYAGASADPEPLRRRLVDQISAGLPPAPATTPLRAVAVGLAVLALVCCIAFGPRGGDERQRAVARAADQAAREGDMARAHAEWERLWRSGAHVPALAARLAWVDAQSGAAGSAAAWVVRGEQLGGRDPALGWVAERVREGGGLVGVSSRRWPVRRLEWGIAALAFGILAGMCWPGRRRVAAAIAVVVLCGLVDPIESLIVSRSHPGVILDPVVLAEAGVDLQPGQVVQVREQRGGRVRIDAGAGVSGWVPAGSVDIATATR